MAPTFLGIFSDYLLNGAVYQIKKDNYISGLQLAGLNSIFMVQNISTTNGQFLHASINF